MVDLAFNSLEFSAVDVVPYIGMNKLKKAEWNGGALPVSSGVSVVTPVWDARLVSEDGVQGIGCRCRVSEVFTPGIYTLLPR